MDGIRSISLRFQHGCGQPSRVTCDVYTAGLSTYVERVVLASSLGNSEDNYRGIVISTPHYVSNTPP